MSELPYMPSHVSDELAKTGHLTNEELGAFRRLTLAMWAAGGYLPDNAKSLARFARAGKRWGIIGPALMAMLTVAGGKVSFRPLLEQLDITRNRRRQAAEAGMASAARRAVEKSHQRAHNQGFSGQQKVENRRPLSASKSLIVNDQRPTDVGLPLQREVNNHNQNQYSSTLVGASRRLADEREHETLYEQGTELLMQRVGLNALKARGQISRWLDKTGGDAEALATVLAAADNFNLQGPNFVTVVDARVAAIETERSKGFALPFGLQKVSEANG